MLCFFSFLFFQCEKTIINSPINNPKNKSGLKISVQEPSEKIHEQRLVSIFENKYGFKEFEPNQINKEKILKKLKACKTESEIENVFNGIGLKNSKEYFASIKAQFLSIQTEFDTNPEMKNWDENQKKEHFMNKITISTKKFNKLKNTKISCDQCMQMMSNKMDAALSAYRTSLWNSFASSSKSVTAAWYSNGFTLFDIIDYFNPYWDIMAAEDIYYATLTSASNDFQICMANCIP